MANFILFDKLCEENYAAPFIESAKALLEKLDAPVSYSSDFKKSLGLKQKAINEEAFYLNNAYNLSIAANTNSTIICPDDSSYLALKLTQDALKSDENLNTTIANKLAIELNTQTTILHLTEFLAKEISVSQIKARIKTPFSKFITTSYEGPNAAKLKKLYDTSALCHLLDITGIKLAKIDSVRDSDGYEIYEVNKNIAELLAGKVLLDAFDNAADFIVINDVTTFSIFDAKQKSIACAVGRDIDLSVLNISQILLLALGETDKETLFSSHRVNVTL